MTKSGWRQAKANVVFTMARSAKPLFLGLASDARGVNDIAEPDPARRSKLA